MIEVRVVFWQFSGLIQKKSEVTWSIRLKGFSYCLTNNLSSTSIKEVLLPELSHPVSGIQYNSFKSYYSVKKKKKSMGLHRWLHELVPTELAKMLEKSGGKNLECHLLDKFIPWRRKEEMKSGSRQINSNTSHQKRRWKTFSWEKPEQFFWLNWACRAKPRYQPQQKKKGSNTHLATGCWKIYLLEVRGFVSI